MYPPKVIDETLFSCEQACNTAYHTTQLTVGECICVCIWVFYVSGMCVSKHKTQITKKQMKNIIKKRGKKNKKKTKTEKAKKKPKKSQKY